MSARANQYQWHLELESKYHQTERCLYSVALSTTAKTQISETTSTENSSVLWKGTEILRISQDPCDAAIRALPPRLALRITSISRNNRTWTRADDRYLFRQMGLHRASTTEPIAMKIARSAIGRKLGRLETGGRAGKGFATAHRPSQLECRPRATRPPGPTPATAPGTRTAPALGTPLPPPGTSPNRTSATWICNMLKTFS